MATKKFKPISKVKSKEEARSIAMNYQMWASEQSLSWLEVSRHNGYFEALAKKFRLVSEFKENGIINNGNL